MLFYVEILDTALSAVGQEHEVLLHDKLMERNLSFLGKNFFKSFHHLELKSYVVHGFILWIIV